MSQDRFSKRHGFSADAADISVREDAPDEVRSALLKIAEGDLHREIIQHDRKY